MAKKKTVAKKQAPKATLKLFHMAWEESERGWGVSPAGCSLHLSPEDYRAFVKDYESRLPDEVPDCYIRPAGSLTEVEVDRTLYNKVAKEKYGMFSGGNIVKRFVQK